MLIFLSFVICHDIIQEDVEREYAEYREFSSSLALGLVKGKYRTYSLPLYL